LTIAKKSTARTEASKATPWMPESFLMPAAITAMACPCVSEAGLDPVCAR
jgi:hypothetical protein